MYTLYRREVYLSNCLKIKVIYKYKKEPYFFLPIFSICIYAFIVKVVDSTVDLSSVLIIYLYLFGENILNIYQSVEKQDGSPRVFAHFSCFHVSLHAAHDL